MVVLKTTNLTKTYGKRDVVNHVSMTINQGDIYGFVGTNGAGKTTMMRMILNLAAPNEGTIELFESTDILKATKKVGSLIETPALYKGCTAYENLRRYSVLYGADESKIPEILKLIGLENTGKKKAGKFSLGMRQRLGIGIALLGDPEFLVLDEPINGLDPVGISEIRNLIVTLNKEKGITFLISSHLLDELSKIATKIGIISNGTLIEEMTFPEIEAQCVSKLVIETDNPEKAKSVLALSEDAISIDGNKLLISENIDNAADYNKKLVMQDIKVSAIYMEGCSLEQFYMQKVGGTIE